MPPMGGERKFAESDETYIAKTKVIKRVFDRNGKNIGSMGKGIAFALA